MNGKALKELEVAILGVGAVGRALSRALVGGGLVRAVRVWARVEGGATELCDELREEHEVEDGRLELHALGDLGQAVSGADLILLCVVDDSVAELAEAIAAENSRAAEGAVALHLSGYVRTGVLAPLRELGYATGGLHPLVSLSLGAGHRAEALSPFVGAHFALGGEAPARERAHELATALGGIPFELAEHESARALYHGAASLLAGGVVALFDAAEQMLGGAVDEGETTARAALLALLQSTVRNLESGAPEQILTGPIRRGDRATVAGHLRALSRSEGAPADVARTEALYRQLSLSMLDLVRRRGGADQQALDSIAALLDGTSNPD